jgi:hypothetical protein
MVTISPKHDPFHPPEYRLMFCHKVELGLNCRSGFGLSRVGSDCRVARGHAPRNDEVGGGCGQAQIAASLGDPPARRRFGGPARSSQ